MVPEKERVAEPRGGVFGWFVSMTKTSNSDFIKACGLDAYFYLRYLRMLLKIFGPAALIFIPILLPINKVGITGSDQRGLDQFAWQNITPSHTDRLWAHLIMAVLLVGYFCYTVYYELKGYIRMRQAYLTSPQHRIRASATTVLVTNIPRKWLTKEELDGLYDVFPGGVRNIWINRNYDELDDLVQKRDDVAQTLEGLYADRIIKAQKLYTKQKKKDPANAQPTYENEERPGVSTGNPHQIQTLDEAVGRRGSFSSDSSHSSDSSSDSEDDGKTGINKLIPSVLNDGLGMVGHGIGAFGHGMGKVGNLVLGKSKSRRGRKKSTDSQRQTTSGTEMIDGEASTALQTDGPDIAPPRSSAEPLSSLETKRSNNDEIPLRDLTKTGTPITTDSVPAPETKKTKTPKKGILGAISGLFTNSLDDELPTTEEYIKMAKAETIRRENISLQKNYVWAQWFPDKDRDTMRVHPKSWINWIPFTGTKVDAIDYYTVVLASMNETIEKLQNEPERFELMNSAFIQFNHQVAAHMACQSLNHHTPLQMAPRTVEIAPRDVNWGNLSLPWWYRYIRTGGVILLCVGLIIVWAPLVTLTSLIGQLSYLAELAPFLSFVNTLPSWLISAVQGILPPALLAVLFLLLPIIFRALSKFAGAVTGSQAELSVQIFYFTFLFIQLFLVVTVSGAIVPVVKQLTDNVASAPAILAINLPKASNYFFSYMILQAFSVSAGALLQIGRLIVLFLWARLVDSTPRSIFKRVTALPDIKWGSFFPIYTNLAVIGLVYSVVAPLILLFNVCTFSLFWVAQRYNALYVNRYQNDTGGLLFPRAVNQLFLGIYTLELCLIGLFFLARDDKDNVASEAQAIIMIVVAIFTVIYQVLLNRAFSPLFRYIPITMEDDAVRRDEEFALMQAKRFAGEETGSLNLASEEGAGDNLQDVLREREAREASEERALRDREREEIARRRQSRSRSHIRSIAEEKAHEKATNGSDIFSKRPELADRRTRYKSS